MTFLERWFEEVWNKRRETAIDEMAAPDAKAYGLEHPDGRAVDGPAAFKQFHRAFCSAFSNIHFKVEHTVTEGDLTVAHCLVTARHTGDGLGMPATGKPLKFTGMCLALIKDGKLVEAWNNFDLATMYRQLQ